jgi:MFS family permease
LLSAALALLVLAISEGPSWGWSNARIIGGFVAAVALMVAFILRSRHHDEPVLDLQLFRSRTFSVANTTMLLYAMGFFAMLLGNILFLTSVWHYSILDAGLSVTPGPLVVALVSGSAGKMAARVGFRPVIITGLSIFTLGVLWYVWRVGTAPDYPSEWLPGTLIVGLGVALTFPVVSAAAVSSLEAARYSVGSAVNQTARQVGGALGVAILVVILGTPTSTRQALHNFDHLWLYIASMTVLAGVAAGALGRRRVARPARVALDVEEARGVEEMLDGEIAVDVLDPLAPRES